MKVSIPTTMASYVRNIYGKHSVTDEPVDYVQQSVRLSLSLSLSVSLCVCLSVCLSMSILSAVIDSYLLIDKLGLM